MAWHICALGDLLEDLPEWDGIVWQRDPSQACDAAMVYGDIDQGEWLAAGRSLSPLVPVGIVGRAPGFLRGDFASPTLAPPAIEEMLAAFTPIRERLGELPPIVAPGQRDFDKLAILGLAYSRGRAIEAERTPSAPETVTYPLLQGRPGLESAMPRTDLEGLANIDLLERRFFTRVLTCSACTSGRMCAFEACVECGSAHLRKSRSFITTAAASRTARAGSCRASISSVRNASMSFAISASTTADPARWCAVPPASR